jgi:transposase-like protein
VRSRDARAAERFFRKAINASHNQLPRVINVDKNAVITPRQLTHVTIDQNLPETTELRPVKYLNNIVELFAPSNQTISQSRHGL